MALTIDEKIQLLKDAVLLMHTEEETVYFDCHDEDGFTVSIKNGDDSILLDVDMEPTFEKAVDKALAKADEQVQARLRLGADLAKRLERYKNPVGELVPEKEGKKK